MKIREEIKSVLGNKLHLTVKRRTSLATKCSDKFRLSKSSRRDFFCASFIKKKIVKNTFVCKLLKNGVQQVITLRSQHLQSW